MVPDTPTDSTTGTISFLRLMRCHFFGPSYFPRSRTRHSLCPLMQITLFPAGLSRCMASYQPLGGHFARFSANIANYRIFCLTYCVSYYRMLCVTSDVAEERCILFTKQNCQEGNRTGKFSGKTYSKSACVR